MKKTMCLLIVLSLIFSCINVSIFAEKPNYSIGELHQILLDYSKNISPMKNNEPASFAISSDETEPSLNWIDFAEEPPNFIDCDDDSMSELVHVIYTAEHLAWVAEQVNNGNTFSGEEIRLKDNIDLGGREWTPIGLPYKNMLDYDASFVAFKGIFNGNGYKIYNLTIKNPTVYESEYEGDGSASYASLFFAVENATVANVAIVNCKLSNKYAIATPLTLLATNSLIYNCYTSGTIESERISAGLVALSQDNIVANCYSIVDFYDDAFVAGLVHLTSKTTVTRCYWSGIAENSNKYDDYDDDDDLITVRPPRIPLINISDGFLYPIENDIYYMLLSYLYWDVDNVPLYEGYDTKKPDKYTIPLTTEQFKTQLPPGFDDEYWGIIPGLTYPYLKVFGEPEFELSVEQATVNSVKVKVGDYAFGCKLFAALYSPDGVLLETKIVPAASGTINFSQPIADNKYKIFLWSDTDKIIPAAIAE